MLTNESVAQTVDAEEIEETAYYICGHLGETKKHPKAQIHKIVEILGPDLALDYLKKVREIERQGGMLTISGKKRRTVGGVFFHLVQTQCDKATVQRIWPKVYVEKS